MQRSEYIFVISIHAPARGATDLTSLSTSYEIISIHAPARGATLSPSSLSPSIPNFNPRTREGCDMTCFPSIVCGSPFQSTHPRGVRRRKWDDMVGPVLFQSTHPRGVRHIDIVARPDNSRFQSTHPRGVRRSRRSLCDGTEKISIHAPARGATGGAYVDYDAIWFISIHAPARGATAVLSKK